MFERQEEFTDQELVSKVRQGDRNAFSKLVRKHQQGLMRLSLRFVKDVDIAEDVVQESLIKSYERLSSFEGRSSFKSWLYQITINTAKNKLREKRDGCIDYAQTNLAVAPVAEYTLSHRAVASQIMTLVEALPDRQKTALILRIYQDLSFKEIAEIMDCPYDTAKANYRHALLKLRTEIEGNPEMTIGASDFQSIFEFSNHLTEVET